MEDASAEIPNMDSKFVERAANIARFTKDLPMCFEKAAMHAYFYASLKKYNGVDHFWKKTNFDQEVSEFKKLMEKHIVEE